MSKAFTLRALLVFLVMWGSTSHAQSVWPGDINNNGVVNGMDVLYWGIANGKTGGVRPGASTNWAAQNMGQPWLWSFAETNGMNYAYADCNGDGKVDVADVNTAVKDNFWKKRDSVTEDLVSPSGTDIKLDLSISNLEAGYGSPGQHTLIKVMLSKEQLAKVDFYGIAFTLKYDPKLISNQGILFQKSNTAWIDPTNTKAYLFQKNLYEEGKCEIAITRTDLKVVDGSGEIGKLEFYLRNESGVNKTLEIKIEKVRIIDSKLKSYSVNDIDYRTIVLNRDPEGGNNNNDDDDDDHDNDNDNDISCPKVVDPVCGKDGKVYLNSCYAEKAGVDDYTLGVCNPDCIDPTQINPDAVCPAVYDPVCGCNGVTYANECEAKAAGVKSYKKGTCKENSNCYDPNLVLSAAYTTLNNNNGVIAFTVPTTDEPVCGCNGVTYKNSYAAEASGIKTYTKGKCSTSCVDPLRIDPNANCTLEYAPVCGCNGVTYTNACKAEAAGVVSYTPGVCGSNNTPAWCSKATPINCGDFLSGENNANAGNNISTYPCSSKNYGGPEKVYIINKSGAGDLQIGLEILNSGLDLDLFLLSSNCNTITCLKSSTTNNAQTNNEGIVLEDAPAGTYYLVVDGAAAGQYRLELSCGNLDCSDAIALTCGQTYSGKNNNGQDNVSLYGCSSNTLNVENNGPEKVHTFTISQAGPVSISLTGLSANLELFLLSSCERGSCIEFSQNSGTNNETITANLQPGTYYVVVDGNNGATSNYKLTVNCAEAICNLGLTLTATAATCGQNSGAIKVQSTGGSPAYIVAWSGPVSGNLTTSNSNITLQGLPAGNYTITVTDFKNCKVTKAVTVNSGGNLTAQTTVTNANCGQSGKVKITVSGGSPKYTVYLSGAESGTFESNSATFDLNDLIPGTYHLYIKDNSGCSVSKDFNVSQQESNFYFTGTPSPAACETPGSIAIKTFGGTAPYKVYVSGPKSGSVTVNATNFNIVDLPGGNYTIKIIDANGCSYTLSVTITTGELLASITPQNGTCVQPGAIKINITSGKPNFIISWSGPVSSSVTTSNTAYTISNLPAGSYTITIKDGNWCAVMKVVTILGGESGFDVVLVPENGVCETKASINVKVEGGTKPYKITWTGAAGGNITTEGTYYEIANLPSGNYSVSVKDVNGCTVSSSTQVVVANSGLALNLTAKNATCLQSGAILVDVDGGFPNYAIKWEGPVNGSFTSNTDKYEIKNLPPGTYKITVFDNNWCSVTKTVTIVGASEGFDIILHPENGACETKGAVGIEILGGSKPYNVSWSGPVGGNATVNGNNYEFSNLPNGTYNVTVKDANGCSVSESTQVVVANSGLSLEFTTKNATCIQSGGILLDINGGIAKYIIKWEGPVNGSFTSNTDKYEITNLPPGTYKITITDGNWCTLTKTIIITGSTEGFDIDLTPESGACEMPGGLSLKINGGTKPYKVTWSGPVGGNATVDGNLFGIDNLPGGTYSVKVTDKNGCSVTENTQILVANSNLSLVFTAKNATCVQSGSVLVDVNGGSPNYVFEWSGPVNGSFTSSSDKYEILNLPAGTYTIKVTDGNWCRITKTVVITGSTEGFDIDLTPENGACETPGEINIKVNGGTKPYKITWTGPAGGNATVNANTYEIPSLPGGTYTVTVKDVNGCTVSESTQILVANNGLSLKLLTKEATCVQGGGILVDVDGGIANYVIKWEGPTNGTFTSGSDKYEITNLVPGTYTIKITDGNWCTITKTITVNGSSSGLTVVLNPENGVCQTAASINVEIKTGQAPYKITWTGPVNGSANSDTKFYDINNLPAGTYTVVVKDVNGCTATKGMQVVNGESDLYTTLALSSGNCGSNGSILLNIFNGEPVYQVSWSGPVNGAASTSASSVEIKNLPSGTYSVKVIDKNGCSHIKTISIANSPADLFKAIAVNGTCESPGAIKLTFFGNTSYTIKWTGPQNGSAVANGSGYNIVSLPTGTYTVKLTDSNGCTETETVQVSASESNLSFTTNFSSAACGQNGVIKVTINSGTPNYKITWEGPQGGSYTSNSNVYEIKNIPAGTYTISVMDGNWCTASKTVSLSQTPGNIFTATPHHGACESLGSIALNFNSGVSRYKIQWSGPVSGTVTEGGVGYNLTNLTAGTYTVKVTDAQGCVDTKTVTINVAQNNLGMNASLLAGNCGQASTIWVNILGGAPIYMVTWEGPQNGSQQVTANGFEIPNVPPGKYTITIKDANWCMTTTMITVYQSPGMIFNATPKNGICETPGSIKLNFTSGTQPYAIQWTGPAPGSATTAANEFTIQNLPVGTYTVKVTDKNGCVNTKTVTVGQDQGGINVNTSLIVNDCGQYNTIWIDYNGGNPPYVVVWEGPVSGMDTTNNNGYEIPNLPPGKYTITIKDSNWCFVSKMITIYEAPASIFTATPIGGGCEQNGGIKLAFTGTPNYQVILGGTVKDTFTVTTNADTIPNLPAGTYTVKVTDAKGCTETETVTVTGAGNLVATITSENGTCDSTGSIKVNITAGTGPFSIILAGALSDTLIANNIGISTIANLNAGSYIITVKANGCAVTDTVTITITEGLVNFTTSQVGGNCASSSSLLLNIEGGNPNYTITWSGQGANGSATTANNTFTIPNLLAGNYTITVKDVSSCVESELVKITAGESNLAVSATVTNGTCGQAGQVLVSATGGTAPFTFSWNGGSTTTSNPTYTIQNLNSGTYSVSVQDAGGCSQSKMVSVTNSNQMPVANFSFSVNGTAVTFTNQSSPGTYQWSFGDNGGASNLNNPNHSYGSTGTFNACLKVTNTCGTQEICKQITIGAPQGAAVIDVEDGSGSKGATIYIPVVIENCVTGATVSFAGSLKIENPSVATITGIVPGSISPQYSANNQTFSFFSNNGAGIPCGVGQILFYVAVELKGNSGVSTILNITNTPLPVELGGMVNGAPTVVPHYITSGQISILSTARIKGEIATYWGQALPDIEVKITGENYNKTEITDSLGRYSKPDMPLSKEYTIVPRFNEAPENGLSTYALFAGQRFILGMQPEEIVSPYQIIAGDANCDNRFSSLDLFVIQRLIIGTSTNFGSCPSWIFVRAGEQMPIEFNTTNVFPYPTCDTLMLMKDTISNFVGVKVGDILGHANPANIHGTSPRSNGILNLWATNRPIRAGEIVEIPLTSDNFQSIAAYQLGMSFDFTKLDFVELSGSENPAFAKIALNDKQANEGVLRMSWFDINGQGITLQPNEKLFTLRFVALQDMESLTQALEMNSRYIRSEAYNHTAEQLKIQLNFKNATTTDVKEEATYGYKLYQNVPNPFNQRTVIGFDLPKAMQADVVIFDQLGKVVKTYSGNYNQGYNQLEMPRETLSAGVYYYTLRTADFAATKPMIVFE